MASLTTNLKLRVADSLTSDAIYNLQRIDLLGSIFPLGSTEDVTINSSGNIILAPEGAISLGGATTVDGSLTLTAGAFNFTLQTSTQASNITLTLPPDVGTAGQFLTTDGIGTMTWTDPPSASFATLNDTSFSSLQVGQVAQWNGSTWTNQTLPNALQSGTFTWSPFEGKVKTIVHGYGSDNIAVWIYDSVSNCQVFLDTIDYSDLNTIVLTSDDIPANDYLVHLIQVS